MVEKLVNYYTEYSDAAGLELTEDFEYERGFQRLDREAFLDRTHDGGTPWPDLRIVELVDGAKSFVIFEVTDPITELWMRIAWCVTTIESRVSRIVAVIANSSNSGPKNYSVAEAFHGSVAIGLPTRRPDGSFSVDIILSQPNPPGQEAATETLAARLAEWLPEWSATNRNATSSHVGVLARDPRLVRRDGHRLFVRADITATAPESVFKPYLVKLVEDIRRDFPSVWLDWVVAVRDAG